MQPDERARAFQLEPFDDFLALERGNSERTREAYRRDVERLVAWSADRSIARPADFTTAQNREFVYHLKYAGMSASSISRNIA
jgi:site-specific recombinase XerD